MALGQERGPDEAGHQNETPGGGGGGRGGRAKRHSPTPHTLLQALPVEKGLKFAANAWIHLYNYKTPNHWGCTGAFG